MLVHSWLTQSRRAKLEGVTKKTLQSGFANGKQCHIEGSRGEAGVAIFRRSSREGRRLKTEAVIEHVVSRGGGIGKGRCEPASLRLVIFVSASASPQSTL